ncbi:mitogen-activated protein kinase organizer 1 [Entomortierella parvispora]|uniref:Mitogen-activated protein kinase organizer 1 n=1 Tax=Entomortierella parvispora TaxID=205924 RepID=A0A9P3H317_9FUNG|nr:mitogen-activated protein kinase organizer 1 [Entomortierella parvispora]
MPPQPTMSIAATLAAHRSKAAITNKYQPTGQSAGPSKTPPPASPSIPLSSSRQQPPPSSSSQQSSKNTSLTTLPPQSSRNNRSVPKAAPQHLPIYVDKVVTEATGSSVNACQYNTTGEYILTGGKDRTIRLWNPEKRYCIKTYEAHGWEVFDLAVSPENGKFASCGGDKTVFLWDVLSGTTLRRFSGHTQRVNAVEFNDDGTVVASGSYDATIRLWDCRSQLYTPIQVLEEFKDSVTSIEIRGSDLLAGCVDGSIRIYDIRMGSLITDQIFEPVTSVCFSKDGNCILASSLDDTIRLMDRANGGLLNAYKGHKNHEYKIRSCLSNSDAHVISGSEDGKIYMWDLIESEVVHKIDAHSKLVSSVAYHPKEDRMCSASIDGSIKTWATSPTEETWK